MRGASDPDSRNAALIRAMVGLASDLNMQTTAEGVETQDELLLVRNLGCSLVQGYIFGKPMPAEEALELAAKGRRDAARRICRRANRGSGSSARRCSITQGRVIGARLRNISSGGALVECREEIPVGAEIQLDFAAGGLIDAEVRWTKGTQFGVPVQREVQPQAAPAERSPRPSRRAVMTPNYLTARDDAVGDK